MTSPSTYDLALPIPASMDPVAWRQFDWYFLPGPGKPARTAPGHRLWLRHLGVLVYSVEITELEYRTTRSSDVDEREHGPGWLALVDPMSTRDEGIAVAAIADPEGVANPWGQNLRYIDPGPPMRFVRSSAKH